MKKIRNTFCVLFALIMCLMSGGCASANELAIENHNWQIARVQFAESAEIIYCSADEANLHQDAEIIDLSCTAENGVLIITNNPDGQTWTLNYSDMDSAPEAVSYKINDNNGNAVVGKTTYHDNSFEYTLIISVDNYVMYFSDKPQN